MIGIDEVGRGAWAGPLLVVAARLRREIGNYKDSKLLSRVQRNKLIDHIAASFDIGEGWVDANEIDACGLAEAMRLGVRRALNNINATSKEKIIMDGPVNYCASNYHNVTCLIKADALISAVSAASIYAKVRRDDYMAELDKAYPEYGFAKHVGYGTGYHKKMLDTFGPSAIHRMSFKPMRVYANEL